MKNGIITRTVFGRLVCLVLSLLLLVSLGLSGCTPATTDPSAPPATNGPSSTPNKPEDEEGPEAGGLPIVSESVTFSFYYPFTSTIISSRAESMAIHEMEKRTNVHIDWVEPADSGDLNAVMSLMFSSNDFSDFIYMGNVTYPGGDVLGVANGDFIRLNEHIDQYCPNYKNIIDTWGIAYEKDVKLDDGTIYSFYNVALKEEGTNFGMAVREDLTKPLGIEMPVTISEWESMLTAFRDNYPDIIPLTCSPFFPVGAYRGTFAGSQFVSAYGIANEFYQVDGEVRFGPIQPEFKQYLELMSDWYSKGLLDPEFASRQPEFVGLLYEAASYDAVWGVLRNRFGDFDIRAVRAPVVNVGDKIKYGVVNSPIGAATVITSALDHDLDVACKWFDYQYTEEAMLLNCYGPQGANWDYDANGEPQFNEKFIKETEETGDAADDIYHRDAINGPGLVDLTRNYKAPPAVIWEASLEIAVWEQDGTEYTLPGKMSLTDEEAVIYSAKYNDIKTFYTEWICKTIMGQNSLDDFDKFVQQMKDMGIEQMIQIKQDSYDRYLAR